MKTDTPTGEGCYNCGKIGHYVNNYPEKLARSSQNKQQTQQIQKVHNKQVQGGKVKWNYIQGRLNHVDMVTTHKA